MIDAYQQTGFLVALADRGILGAFAQLHKACRQRPAACARLVAPAYQHHLALQRHHHPNRRHGVTVENEAAGWANLAVAIIDKPSLHERAAARAVDGLGHSVTFRSDWVTG